MINDAIKKGVQLRDPLQTMGTVLEMKNWTTATSVDGRGAHKYSCRSNYSRQRTASCSKQNAIKIISVRLSLGVALHDVCTLQTWYTQKTGTWLCRTLVLYRDQNKRKLRFMMYLTNSVIRNVRASKFHNNPRPLVTCLCPTVVSAWNAEPARSGQFTADTKIRFHV